jgi:hypothetical protein
MRSKGNAPTAAQIRWREAVRELGSVISGEPAVIHHCVGASGKHNKIAIGHWWIIPLTDEEHKALHAGETFGYDSRKEFEKHEFYKVGRKLVNDGAEPVMPVGVVIAIMGYHR